MGINFYFPEGRLKTASEVAVSSVNVYRGLPGALKSVSVANATGRSRLRSGQLQQVACSSGVQGCFSARISLAPGEIRSTTTSSVNAFVNARPIAPPQGLLMLQSLESLRNPGKPAGPPLAGRRLMKGDTTPLFFWVEGERLSGLQAYFVARQIGVAPGIAPLTIEKFSPAGIVLTSPAKDPATGIETLTGNFSIDPIDTTRFPDNEIQFSYKFVLGDGVGRSYTIESSTLTFYAY